MPPQEWSDRKSTGDLTLGVTGYLRRKSSSVGFISLFISRIWRGHNKQKRTMRFCTAMNRAHFLYACLEPNWAICLRSKRSVVSLYSKANHAEEKTQPLCLPERQAEPCTWACHTQTGLWSCTGKLRRWCCQLGWTPAASESRPAQLLRSLSGRPRWTPDKTQGASTVLKSISSSAITL